MELITCNRWCYKYLLKRLWWYYVVRDYNLQSFREELETEQLSKDVKRNNSFLLMPLFNVFLKLRHNSYFENITFWVLSEAKQYQVRICNLDIHQQLMLLFIGGILKFDKKIFNIIKYNVSNSNRKLCPFREKMN